MAEALLARLDQDALRTNTLRQFVVSRPELIRKLLDTSDLVGSRYHLDIGLPTEKDPQPKIALVIHVGRERVYASAITFYAQDSDKDILAKKEGLVKQLKEDMEKKN